MQFGLCTGNLTGLGKGSNGTVHLAWEVVGCIVPEEPAPFSSAYEEEADGNYVLLLQCAHCIT